MGEKLLIVDDEPEIREMLAEYFEWNGYTVLTAENGSRALELAEREPELILLDVNLPDLDGLSVCEAIREHLSCPILFLTARVEDADKLRGFAAGGDDYIVKPFSLELLTQNPGQVFDRERIYERVWGYDSAGDSSVIPEHIRRIRQKLGESGIQLETVWGVGYRWKR